MQSDPAPGRRADNTPTPPRRRRAARLLVAAITLALGGLLTVSAWEALRPATPVAVTPAVFVWNTQPAEPADTPDKPSGRAAQAAGWIEADPYYIGCTALAGGVVDEILVLEGQAVEQGQVVARLIDDDARLALDQANARLDLARAGVLAAQADLTAAQDDWDNPIDRNRQVAVADAQLRETIAELDQLPSLITAERERLERLREELTLLEGATASGAGSSFELMTIRRQAQAQAAVAEALERRAPILEARRDRLRAEAEAAKRNAALRIPERRALESARAALARAQAEQDRAQAALAEAQLRMDRMTIRAPITGLVQERLKSPGDKAMLDMDDPESAHILHLYDPAHLQVRVDVPLADAGGIVVGQACEVVIEVLPDRTFAGEVTRITHQADLQKNTLEVKVRILEPDPMLKPEMLTRVKFLAGDAARPTGESAQGRDAVRVPQQAVRESAAGPTGWVVRDRRDGRGIAKPVALSLGAASDGWVEVTGDLRAGDLLIVGDTPLNPGQRVRILSSQETG